MIKINILAIGRIRDRFLADGIEEYKKRLKRFANVEVSEIKESYLAESPSKPEIAAALKKEGEELLKRASGFTAALCVEGAEFDSPALSAKLREMCDEKGEITFIIGSSYGLSEELKAKADLKLSFSKLTFPHTLMRLILFEQLFRAFSIDSGGPYHK